MLRRLTSNRVGICAGVLALLILCMALVAPAPAHALPDLIPDIPGPTDIAEGIFKFFFETFFGIEAKVSRRAIEFLVAQPIYTDAKRYPDLNTLRSYVTAGGWGVFTLVFTASALRYWAAGFTSSSSYQALESVGRSIVAAGALVVYPTVFEYLTVAGNLMTHALLNAPGVESGMTRLLAAALVLNFGTLGVGSIATVVAVVILILLVITKIVLATILALLFVSAPLALALWPLPETSWAARSWLQGLIAVVLWPIVWALCFALFAVMGKSAFSLSGSFGDNLIKPWVTVASLFVAFKAPQLIARQAMMAGLSPSIGGGVSRALVYGRMAGRAGGGAAVAARGSAAGYSGRAVGAPVPKGG
ncbi:MAG: hypothetical protein WKF96_15240 [Solirubrobacteraceae bacterium]